MTNGQKCKEHDSHTHTRNTGTHMEERQFAKENIKKTNEGSIYLAN